MRYAWNIVWKETSLRTNCLFRVFLHSFMFQSSILFKTVLCKESIVVCSIGSYECYKECWLREKSGVFMFYLTFLRRGSWHNKLGHELNRTWTGTNLSWTHFYENTFTVDFQYLVHIRLCNFYCQKNRNKGNFRWPIVSCTCKYLL